MAMPLAESAGANEQVRGTATRGWSIERHGDAVILTSPASHGARPAGWRDLLLDALRSMPGVAMVGGKRLDARGRIHSMGEFLIHPKGFHHLGRGTEGAAYRFPEEVDAVCGGVVAARAGALNAAAGGAGERTARPIGAGELSMVDLCLSIRAAGRRIIAIPHVEVEDEFTPAPAAAECAAFRDRWGFDWRAADLDVVRRLHAGTGLLWNVRFHAPPMPFEKYTQRPALHWTSYETVEPYRRRADHLVGLVRRVTVGGGRVLDLGCGDGLFTALMARAGLDATGVDPEQPALDQAARRCAAAAAAAPRAQGGAGGSLEAAAPRFVRGNGEELPCADESIDTVAMFDVIEHLPNPVAVLREVTRVLVPGGHLVISTPCWQFGGSSDAVYHVCEYTMEELVRQVEAGAGMQVVDTGRIGGVYRDLLVVARRAPGANGPRGGDGGASAAD
jgi:2-polyprenyl-3-methyl-5-hydroxy-6-metoxy-1,4-benzoquinol methylase